MSSKIGQDFILDGRAIGASAAMVALYSHACDWCLTIDCLHYGDGLPLADAIRVADAGFRGDNIRAARRVLATLNKGI